MPEFNLAQATFWVGKDDGADLDAKPSTAPATALGVYGTVSINPTRETVRIPPAHNVRRGRVVSNAGGGTITISIVRDNDSSGDARAAFFDEVEASVTGRFIFAGNPYAEDGSGNFYDDEKFAGAVMTAAADNPLYSGHAVLTSLDVWGAGGDEPAVMVVSAELDRDYRVDRS